MTQDVALQKCKMCGKPVKNIVYNYCDEHINEWLQRLDREKFEEAAERAARDWLNGK